MKQIIITSWEDERKSMINVQYIKKLGIQTQECRFDSRISKIYQPKTNNNNTIIKFGRRVNTENEVLIKKIYKIFINDYSFLNHNSKTIKKIYTVSVRMEEKK